MVKRGVLIGLVALITAGAVAAIVVVSSPGGAESVVSASVGEGTRAVVVTTGITPEPSRVGDRLVATLDFRVEVERADANSVRVLEARFPPFTQLAPPTITRTDVGDLSFIRFEYPLQCRELACVASEEAIRFPRVSVRWIDRIDGVASQGGDFVDWPEVTIVPRVADADLVQPELAAVSTGEAEPTYRINPDFLGWLFLGVAAALVVGVGAGAGWKLWGSAPRPEESDEPASEESSPLEGALTALEALPSWERDEARQALDSLSRALEAAGIPDLARQARRLAWSPATPEQDAVRDLIAGVRQALEEAA